MTAAPVERKGWSRSGSGNELENKGPDRCRLMFTGVRRESIRPFKSIRALHSQVPCFSRTRSGNRHAPLALAPTESMLQVYGNVAAELSVAEILQFDRNSHPCNSIRRRTPRLQLSAERRDCRCRRVASAQNCSDAAHASGAEFDLSLEHARSIFCAGPCPRRFRYSRTICASTNKRVARMSAAAICTMREVCAVALFAGSQQLAVRHQTKPNAG